MSRLSHSTPSKLDQARRNSQRLLNTAQRLAEAVRGDLLSEPHKLLDSATIENMRVIAARHSDARA